MRAFEIMDLKDFTSKLFLGTLFDSFYLKDASFTTFATFTIDGYLQKNFYDTEQQETLDTAGQSLIHWSSVRNIAFQMIRGKRSPLQFHVVLSLSPEANQKFFDSTFDTTAASYYMNLQFRSNKLLCTTGVSLRSFSLNQKPSSAWDDGLASFFQNAQISFSEP